MQSDPACAAIMLSDTVIREQGTGKLSLIGCFTALNAPKFPFATPPFFVTPFITNLRGKIEDLHITVRIEDAHSFVLSNVAGHVSLRKDAPPVPDVAVLEIPFPVAPFMVQTAGNYLVKVLLNNEQIGVKPLIVRSVTASAEQKEIP